MRFWWESSNKYSSPSIIWCQWSSTEDYLIILVRDSMKKYEGMQIKKLNGCPRGLGVKMPTINDNIFFFESS